MQGCWSAGRWVTCCCSTPQQPYVVAGGGGSAAMRPPGDLARWFELLWPRRKRPAFDGVVRCRLTMRHAASERGEAVAAPADGAAKALGQPVGVDVPVRGHTSARLGTPVNSTRASAAMAPQARHAARSHETRRPGPSYEPRASKRCRRRTPAALGHFFVGLAGMIEIACVDRTGRPLLFSDTSTVAFRRP